MSLVDFTTRLSSVEDSAKVYGVEVMTREGTLHPNILIDVEGQKLGIVP